MSETTDSDNTEPDNPYTYGADTLTPEESDRIKARFDAEEETI